MAKNTKPTIRFKGFTDDWEQRKLKEIACKVKNKNKENAISETFTNSAEFGIISQKDFFDHEVASKTNLDNYYIVDIDDFVYNPRISVTAPVGPINRNKLGNAGVMSPLYTVFTTQGVFIDFLEHYFKSTTWHSYMYLNGDSGARSDRFSIKDDVFFDMPIMVPCIKEQEQIGLLFNAISKNITLHQRKYDSLVNVKKAMFEKMFPKNGETVPEIRFKGFTDTWEQRKLSELAEFNPKCNLPNSFEYVDLESVVGTEMISSRFEIKENAPSRAQRLAKKGDVFYQTVRPYQRNNYLFDKEENNYVFSTGYAQLRPNCNSRYLLNLLQTDSFVNIVLNNCTGTSYPAINSSDLGNINVITTKNIREQTKIGEIFYRLDKLITLHQRRLEKLKNIKKSCLEKMFV